MDILTFLYINATQNAQNMNTSKKSVFLCLQFVPRIVACFPNNVTWLDTKDLHVYSCLQDSNNVDHFTFTNIGYPKINAYYLFLLFGNTVSLFLYFLQMF